jgi:fructose-1-phosphate kinase PfkB-like protein
VEVFHLVFPTIFYGRIAEMAKQAGRKVVIDTSGPLLKAAYKQVCISPSLREFKDLDG